MAVEECAVSSSAEFVAGWCVVETCDGIIEPSDTIGAGFDQAGVAADLTEPTLYHRVVAGDHESIIES